MSFEQYLKEQLDLHPSMQYQDMVKLCYQAAFGAEHLVMDENAAEKFLEEEFDSIVPCDIALFEQISDKFVRVNLAAWKHRRMPLKWLFNIFRGSTNFDADAYALMEEHLCKCGEITYGSGWRNYVDEYTKQGIRPVHHSQIYRDKEHPAYRLADVRFTRLFPLLEKLCDQAKHPCVIAIDGRAASGKTTMAHDLASVIGADIVHMDDFFLPLELRTPERLNEAGGNIHYERFRQEVLPYISEMKSFSYRVFSCSEMDYSGLQTISSKSFRIVEGAYCMHPAFGDYADIYVFSDVDTIIQRERIIGRNGISMAKVFTEKWIPMEERYISAFNVENRCDLKL